MAWTSSSLPPSPASASWRGHGGCAPPPVSRHVTVTLPPGPSLPSAVPPAWRGRESHVIHSPAPIPTGSARSFLSPRCVTEGAGPTADSSARVPAHQETHEVQAPHEGPGAMMSLPARRSGSPHPPGGVPHGEAGSCCSCRVQRMRTASPACFRGRGEGERVTHTGGRAHAQCRLNAR